MSFESFVKLFVIVPSGLFLIGYGLLLQTKNGTNWQIKNMGKYSPYKINPKTSRNFINRQSLLLIISGSLMLSALFTF